MITKKCCLQGHLPYFQILKEVFLRWRHSYHQLKHEILGTSSLNVAKQQCTTPIPIKNIGIILLYLLIKITRNGHMLNFELSLNIFIYSGFGNKFCNLYKSLSTLRVPVLPCSSISLLFFEIYKGVFNVPHVLNLKI